MALESFVLLLSMLALGKLGARSPWLAGRGSVLLHRVVLWVCLPASILLHAPQLELGIEVLAVAAIPWAILVFSIVAVALLGRVTTLSAAQRTVLLLCVPLGNTSFLGYPLTRALLGEDAVSTAVVYDQFGSFVILATWGLWVLARHGGTRPSVGSMLRRVLSFPPVFALVLGLTVMPVSPPPLVETVLRAVAWSLLPVAAFAVGLTLQLGMPRAELVPFVAGLALKLVVMPASALGLAWLMELPTAQLQVAVLETAMPPMITAGVLAIAAGAAPRLAAALVGYGTLIAFPTLLAWAWLLR